MSNLDFKGKYRRKLPHLQPPGATLFVTTRLAGSLPKSVLGELARQLEAFKHSTEAISLDEETLSLKLERFWFKEFERLLHETQFGPRWLAMPAIADLVADIVHFADGRQYQLEAYCVMPNHMHLVFTPLPTASIPPEAIVGSNAEGEIVYRLPSDPTQIVKVEYFALALIMHRIKRRSSRDANVILKRVGDFWEHESFDHYVRDEDELFRIIAYVLNNPVKAGLVANWQDWKWTYVRQREAFVAQDGILCGKGKSD